MNHVLPLNGSKTRPLSSYATAELRNIAVAPVPRCSVNPGVVNRLLRGGLVEIVLRPSPFRRRASVMIEHLKITAAGNEMLEVGHE
ncbi:hypothetical protein [Oleomonas cavernae]|uniref:hypothetical protein n=1 Tax=Oleomonas cavernae TaxID=2320859 RepID=UPI0011C3939E|nr:hypothetical protein [Oleomonas cavernae]